MQLKVTQLIVTIIVTAMLILHHFAPFTIYGAIVAQKLEVRRVIAL